MNGLPLHLFDLPVWRDKLCFLRLLGRLHRIDLLQVPVEVVREVRECFRRHLVMLTSHLEVIDVGAMLVWHDLSLAEGEVSVARTSSENVGQARNQGLAARACTVSTRFIILII